MGSINMLGLAKRTKAKILQASTSEVYGDPLEHPQKESYWGHVDPVGLRSMYDEAKRFAEALTMSYHRFHGLNTRIVRIFNTFGPRMRLDDGRVVPNFLKQALQGKPLTIYGDGEQTRSFCFVDDLIEGIYQLLLVDEPYPVNIGNPRETTIIELAEIVNRLSGNTTGVTYKPRKRGAGDPQRRQPDISRASKLLGWKPEVNLEVGLDKTIRYFRRVLDLQ